MDLWLEIVNIAESILFTDEPDSLIWTLNSKGLYSVQSLYAVVNFRGVKPVYPNAICGLCIPPRVQVFLWLLSKNKLLTRDNLSKRSEVSNKSCLFCVLNLKVLTTSFLSVVLLKQFGLSSLMCLILI